MSPTATLARPAAIDVAPTTRRIVHVTRGHGHGPIVRLMSPSDLGAVLKPFVFLDLFEADMRRMQEAMQLHPHSGIATVTVFTQGDVRYDDPLAGKGSLVYGGVEWMRASGGVWHGKEIAAGVSPRVQGFQLWVALPPELENETPDAQYVEAADMPQVGPAHVIVGAYDGVRSPVRSPDGLTYLLVTLKPGETWTYAPPKGQSVGWLAVARGDLTVDQPLRAGDMAILEPGDDAVSMTAGADSEAVFVLGSAVPHDHPLHLGPYSVHTTAEALRRGEDRIRDLHRSLLDAGDRRTTSGATPIYR